MQHAVTTTSLQKAWLAAAGPMPSHGSTEAEPATSEQCVASMDVDAPGMAVGSTAAALTAEQQFTACIGITPASAASAAPGSAASAASDSLMAVEAPLKPLPHGPIEGAPFGLPTEQVAGAAAAEADVAAVKHACAKMKAGKGRGATVRGLPPSVGIPYATPPPAWHLLATYSLVAVPPSAPSTAASC